MKRRTIFILLGVVVVAVAAGAAYVLMQPSANDNFSAISAALGSSDADEQSGGDSEVTPPREIVAGVWSRSDGRVGNMLAGFEAPAVELDERVALSGYSKNVVFGFECYPENGFASWKGLIARIEGTWLHGTLGPATEAPVFISVDNEEAVLKTFTVADSRSLLVMGGDDGRALLEKLITAEYISLAIPGQTAQFRLDDLKTVSVELLSQCPGKTPPKAAIAPEVVIIESDDTDIPPPPPPVE
jgi:hypothetical protein